MKAFFIGFAVFFGVVFLSFLGLLFAGYIYGETYVYDAPEHVELNANEFNTVTAVGKGLYDENGDRYDIKGINFGNLFLTEAWMSINSVGAKTDKNGNYIKVSDDGNNIVEEYEEIYQDTFTRCVCCRILHRGADSRDSSCFSSYE